MRRIKKYEENPNIKNTYRKRQEKWIAKHNIEIGTKVKLLRGDLPYRFNGWSFQFPLILKHHLGKRMIGTVTNINKDGIFVNTLLTPYFVLRPIYEKDP